MGHRGHCLRGRGPRRVLLLLHLQKVDIQEEEQEKGQGQGQERHQHEGRDRGRSQDGGKHTAWPLCPSLAQLTQWRMHEDTDADLILAIFIPQYSVSVKSARIKAHVC